MASIWLCDITTVSPSPPLNKVLFLRFHAVNGWEACEMCLSWIWSFDAVSSGPGISSLAIGHHTKQQVHCLMCVCVCLARAVQSSCRWFHQGKLEDTLLRVTLDGTHQRGFLPARPVTAPLLENVAGKRDEKASDALHVLRNYLKPLYRCQKLKQ